MWLVTTYCKCTAFVHVHVTVCSCQHCARAFLRSYLQLLAVKEKRRVMAPNAFCAVSDLDVCGVLCRLIHFLHVQLGSNDLKVVL